MLKAPVFTGAFLFLNSAILNSSPLIEMKAKISTTRRQTKATVPAADEGGSFLDKNQVAKRLGLTPRTIGIWVQQEKLPAYRFGRFLRFKWAEVEQALATTFRVVNPKGGA
jgi:excisionase family DNA binding protein